ncbi:hypothetical protein X975_26094, partial [Stegodyphus mimosarum]
MRPFLCYNLKHVIFIEIYDASLLILRCFEIIRLCKIFLLLSLLCNIFGKYDRECRKLLDCTNCEKLGLLFPIKTCLNYFLKQRLALSTANNSCTLREINSDVVQLVQSRY